MICKKCGAPMPDNAKFCGRCGTVVPQVNTSSAALFKARREVRKYKIMSIVLAALCVIMGIGWSISSHDAMRSVENYENEANKIERAGIELSGTFVVGEDEELPEGRYNIYPPDGESYMDVDVYVTKEDARQKYDEEYNSLAQERIYRVTRGHKFKAGQIVVIESGSAYFELVAESGQSASEEAEGTDGEAASDASGENEDAGTAAETE